MSSDEEPAFVIWTADHVWKIYRSGRVEGFPEGAAIVNRIPLLTAEEISKERKDHGLNTH